MSACVTYCLQDASLHGRHLHIHHDATNDDSRGGSGVMPQRIRRCLRLQLVSQDAESPTCCSIGSHSRWRLRMQFVNWSQLVRSLHSLHSKSSDERKRSCLWVHCSSSMDC
jgi:hypothetical protein